MNYKREIRFVLTNKCNFNCIFCHNEGVGKKIKINNVIKPSDYEFIAKVSEECLDIKKFVLTGGEPLLVPNVIDIAKAMY